MTNRTIIRPLGVALLATALLATAACDTLLSVDNPGSVTEEGLASEEAIPVLIASAYGELVDAFEDVVLLGGLFTDELTHSGSFPDYGRTDLGTNVQNDWLGEYQTMSTARFLADLAVERVRAATDPPAGALAEALAYAGWSRIFLAEQMCEVTIDGGPSQSPDAIMQAAETLLSEAISSGGDEDVVNFARVGRARARLWLGDNAGVVSDAGAVPADFSFDAVYDVTANDNSVVVFTVSRRETSIEMPFWNNEAIPQCSENPAKAAFVPDCPFGIEGDVGPDNETPLFVQQVYKTESTDMPIATGEMAEWYAMEAQGTADEFEQAVALYLTGNRLGQMRRLNHPYLQGRQSCWILPEREKDTNPNL